MADFIFYEEYWNIREGEIQQGGTSPTSSSADGTKRS
jgi:hypothetical protein